MSAEGPGVEAYKMSTSSDTKDSTEVGSPKAMDMVKLSPLVVGYEFVRQYYTLLSRAPDMLYRFYAKNSSYSHGGLDDNGKPEGTVYGQEEIHRKVMSQNFTNCRTKVLYVDAHATVNEGVVVQVMGLLSKNSQTERSFMQTFVLVPQGSVGNRFYVYNDIFRYQDEVFDCVTKPQEEVEEPEERQQTPQGVPDHSGSLTDQKASDCKDLEHSEEPVVKPDSKSKPEPKPEPVSEIKEEKPESILERLPSEDVQKSSSPAPVDIGPAQKELKSVTWADVASKHLPPKGAVPVKQTSPPLVKVKQTQPHPELKPKTQVPAQKPQREQRVREQWTNIPSQRGPWPIHKARKAGDVEHPKMVRHPDSHQLFVGNLPHEADKSEVKALFQNYGKVLELRILSGGNAPNFGFVVFESSEPVQKILNNRPIMLRGAYRLNVEEKKSQGTREGNLKDNCHRGPAGHSGGLAGGMRAPSEGGMVQKPGSCVGKGTTSLRL